MCNQVVKHLSSTGVLHYQVERPLGLNNFKKLDYIGMIQDLHYSNFSEELLKAVWVQLCLVYYFNCHLSACEHVSGQFDLGKVALADGFEQPVVAYVGLLRLLGAAGRTHARPARACADLLTAIGMRGVTFRHLLVDSR